LIITGRASGEWKRVLCCKDGISFLLSTTNRLFVLITKEMRIKWLLMGEERKKGATKKEERETAW
jgi:hypothetical protein